MQFERLLGNDLIVGAEMNAAQQQQQQQEQEEEKKNGVEMTIITLSFSWEVFRSLLFLSKMAAVTVAPVVGNDEKMTSQEFLYLF